MSDAARFIFHGLKEMYEELRSLPDDNAAEATSLASSGITAARDEVVAAYPARSGKLGRSVVIEMAPSGRFGVRAVLRVTAKHAWLFDNGSQARHNAIGANRGSMPAAHTVGRAMIKARHTFHNGLKALLTRRGFRVHGDV